MNKKTGEFIIKISNYAITIDILLEIQFVLCRFLIPPLYLPSPRRNGNEIEDLCDLNN